MFDPTQTRNDIQNKPEPVGVNNSDTLPTLKSADTNPKTAPEALIIDVDAQLSDHSAKNTVELADEVLQFEGELAPVLTDNLGSTVTIVNNNISSSIAANPNLICWLFQPQTTPRQVGLAEVKQAITIDQNFVWVDLSSYSETDLKEVSRLLNLHPIALRAALSPWQRPRYDNFRAHFFVTATVAHLNPEAHRVFAGELDLFIGRNYLVSAHKLPLPFAKRVLERTRQSPELVELDSAFMLYIVLDELLEYYEELSDHIEDENEKMEQRALKDTSDNFLADLLQHKRYIYALSRLADQHRRIFAALLRPDSPLGSDEEVQAYFHDLEAHFERLLDTLLPAKEAVNGAFDIYVSHMSHRTNKVIKTLTMVSTILLPASVIISLFGTSIVGLPQYNSLEFFIMMGVIILTTAVILFIFHKQGWI